jgi:hypothetical protein
VQRSEDGEPGIGERIVELWSAEPDLMVIAVFLWSRLQ